MKPLKLVLILLGGLSLVLIAASIGGNAWIDNTFVKTGLWKACLKRLDTCISFSAVTDWLKAVRAFTILACLAAVGAVLLSILGLISEKVKGMFASVLFLGAAACMIIGLAIYTSEVGSSTSFGWTYYIGWVGCAFAGVSVIVGFLSDR